MSANILGYYQTTPAIAKKGEITNAADIDEKIKGFMTLKEVSEATGISLDKIYEKVGFTPNQVPADTKCKEISGKLGRSFETSELREIIKEILGQ